MTTEVPEILLSHYLKTLKLPTFQREYQKLARLCATEGVDHVAYLTRLAEREMIERDRRKIERRIKAARFPVVKSLDSFDFAWCRPRPLSPHRRSKRDRDRDRDRDRY